MPVTARLKPGPFARSLKARGGDVSRAAGPWRAAWFDEGRKAKSALRLKSRGSEDPRYLTSFPLSPVFRLVWLPGHAACSSLVTALWRGGHVLVIQG